MRNDKALQLLREAREVMQRFQHHKGCAWGDSSGKGISVSLESKPKVGAVCPYGALQYVRGTDSRDALYDDLEMSRPLLRWLDFKRWVNLFDWNDTEERTKKDVLKRFDNAIRRAEDKSV